MVLDKDKDKPDFCKECRSSFVTMFRDKRDPRYCTWCLRNGLLPETPETFPETPETFPETPETEEENG